MAQGLVLRFTLIYDADCGPCARFRRAVGFLDTYRGLDFASLMDADERGLLDTVQPGLRHRSLHLISPRGTVRSGAEALPELIGLLPGGSMVSRVIMHVPFGYRAIAFVYSVFARLHDAGSCSFRASGQGTRRSEGPRTSEAARTSLGAFPTQK